jgi:hypothetical protein
MLYFMPSMFDTLVSMTKWKRSIRIVDCEKIYGSYNILERETYKLKYEYLIDYSKPVASDMEVRWEWIGITEKQPYVEYPINEDFRHFIKMDDIKIKIPDLKCINDVFYYRLDWMNYRAWACDIHGQVYVKDELYIHQRRYVAHSIAEFLSHMYYEYIFCTLD